jgi:hypothetical protein
MSSTSAWEQTAQCHSHPPPPRVFPASDLEITRTPPSCIFKILQWCTTGQQTKSHCLATLNTPPVKPAYCAKPVLSKEWGSTPPTGREERCHWSDVSTGRVDLDFRHLQRNGTFLSCNFKTPSQWVCNPHCKEGLSSECMEESYTNRNETPRNGGVS